MKYIFILFLAMLMSCNENVQRQVDFYYDTDSLMRGQKAVLSKRKAQIHKRATINGKVSKGVLRPDSLEAWNMEFQIFEKININKPALQDVYQTEEYNDAQSNLIVREYSTDKKDVEVPSLKLYYLGKPENLRFIEAIYVENNPIFKSQRNIRMEFDDFTGRSLLRKYTIKGPQKMIFNDSVHFEVNVEIKP